MLRLIFKFFCIHHYFFQRENTFIPTESRTKIFFESAQKHIEFLSSMIKIVILLNVSYRKKLK